MVVGGGGGGSIRSDLANFIIDLEDEDCPEPAVHVAAYQARNILNSVAPQLMVCFCERSGGVSSANNYSSTQLFPHNLPKNQPTIRE